MIDNGSYSFPVNDEEADRRFKLFGHSDPFAKEIPPALLNSRDISEYVRVTGMVHPFYTEGKLKSASYEIAFLGSVFYWKDGDKENYDPVEIVPDQPFEIPKNSIVFVSPNTIFRLPDYIALRFNLRIKHVHRGLLLGTGPLVDPGFAGRLFIPIHNLTSEPYTIKGGEGLIWVEFTKISPHPHWVKPENKHDGYKHFPKNHRYLTPQQYLNKCSQNGKPSRSSIPLEFSKLREEAIDKVDKAIVDVNKFEKKVERWGIWGGIVAILSTVIAVIIPIYGMVSDVTKYVRESRDSAESSIATYKKAVDEQGAVIAELKKQVATLEIGIKGKATTNITSKSESSRKEARSNSNCAPSPQAGCQQNCLPDCLSK